MVRHRGCISQGQQSASARRLAVGRAEPELDADAAKPEPRERCRIRIGNQFQSWNEGEALIFDDSFNHEVWNDTSGWRVVLFVDFARPLRQPWHWLNRSLVSLGALAPFLREAGQKQKAWEKKFYAKG